MDSQRGRFHEGRARRRCVVSILSVALAALAAWAGAAGGAPVFMPGGAFGTGSAPGHMALADLNRDAVPDVVVANTRGGSVSVLLGDGTGGFLGRTDHGTGVNPEFVSVGDVNGDGNDDVVAALPTMNYIYAFLGTGSGTIGGAIRTYTHSYTLATALGRFDADGVLDVAVGEAEYGAVDILHGNGSGAFSWIGHSVVGGSPNCVLAHDLTGDGKQDLLVVKMAAQNFTVLAGNGDGTFASLGNTLTGGSPVHAAVADLDHDGNLDVVVVNSGSNSVSVYLGLGSGSFGDRHDFDTGSAPRFVAIADLDLNGAADLVVANSGSNTVSILMGEGDGTFEEKSDLAVGGTPMAVLACDLNGDGLPDLVSSNAGDNAVSVMIQQAVAPSTVVTLTTAPNPSLVGQTVTLTATVEPPEAEGQVRFYEGTDVLGDSELSGGRATIELSDLLHQPHVLWACYMGSPEHQGACSPLVEHVVDAAQSATTVALSAVPAYHRLPTRFLATVAPVPPGSGVPTGTVQFWLDGAKYGNVVGLSNGVGTSVATDTMRIGVHHVRAEYTPADTFHYAGSTSANTAFTVVTSNPAIVDVRDVPNDQGGHVFVTWHCPLDQPGYDVVKSYRVWRRVPYLVLDGATGTGELRALPPGTAGVAAADSSGTETFWEAVADLPAARLVSYGFTAPTTQDSMGSANPYTAFIVQAVTALATEFFGSAPDSGYSVDNLSPAAPAPFSVVYGGQSNALHWTASAAPDLREYRLYRGSEPTFVPGASSLVAATTDTGYVDAPGSVFYKLIAVDVHGNPSRTIMASPESPVALLASLVSVDALADRIGLLWYTAGGALEATVYRREGIADWVALGVIAADGSGYLRYTDTDVVPGTRYGYRLGIVDGGEEVFVGEVWTTAEPPQLRLAGVSPNPARGGRLNVEFTLRSDERATLTLFDVSGRQVSGQDVGGLGAGRHQVDLASGNRIRPGVYLVRLTQGHDALVTRVVVVD